MVAVAGATISQMRQSTDLASRNPPACASAQPRLLSLFGDTRA